MELLWHVRVPAVAHLTLTTQQWGNQRLSSIRAVQHSNWWFSTYVVPLSWSRKAETFWIFLYELSIMFFWLFMCWAGWKLWTARSVVHHKGLMAPARAVCLHPGTLSGSFWTDCLSTESLWQSWAQPLGTAAKAIRWSDNQGNDGC